MRQENQRIGAAKVISIENNAFLDALVGRYVTHESPRVFWEDTNSYFRFDSKVEAIEMVGNPSYRKYVSKDDWEAGAVKKVEIYRSYSSDLTAAWAVVEVMSERTGATLRLTRQGDQWLASFDEAGEALSPVAAVAICLAALRATGINAHYESAVA